MKQENWTKRTASNHAVKKARANFHWTRRRVGMEFGHRNAETAQFPDISLIAGKKSRERRVHFKKGCMIRWLEELYRQS